MERRGQVRYKHYNIIDYNVNAAFSGKTLAAESVSEYTKRPLLIISSGELGTQVSEIDQNLTAFLQYAAMWKAIVLIDEADVFLETRMTEVSNRLEQNSLVAGAYIVLGSVCASS